MSSAQHPGRLAMCRGPYRPVVRTAKRKTAHADAGAPVNCLTGVDQCGKTIGQPQQRPFCPRYRAQRAAAAKARVTKLTLEVISPNAIVPYADRPVLSGPCTSLTRYLLREWMQHSPDSFARRRAQTPTVSVFTRQGQA